MQLETEWLGEPLSIIQSSITVGWKNLWRGTQGKNMDVLKTGSQLDMHSCAVYTTGRAFTQVFFRNTQSHYLFPSMFPRNCFLWSYIIFLYACPSVEQRQRNVLSKARCITEAESINCDNYIRWGLSSYLRSRCSQYTSGTPPRSLCP